MSIDPVEPVEPAQPVEPQPVEPQPAQPVHPDPADARDLPSTGDEAVDRLLRELDDRLAAAPDEQVEAVSEAHRQLQARLSGPVPPAPPGQAHPGPR